MDIVAIGSRRASTATTSRRPPRHGLHVLVREAARGHAPRASIEMLDAVDRAGVTLGVFFQDRSTPDLLAVKDALVGRTAGPADSGRRPGEVVSSPRVLRQSLWRGTWALDGGGAADEPGHPHRRSAAVAARRRAPRLRAKRWPRCTRSRSRTRSVAVLEFASGAVARSRRRRRRGRATTAASRSPARSAPSSIEQARVVQWDLREPALEGAAGGADGAAVATAAPPRGTHVVADASAHRRVFEDFVGGARRRPPAAGGRPRGPAQRRARRGDLRVVAHAASPWTRAPYAGGARWQAGTMADESRRHARTAGRWAAAGRR